MKTHEFIRELTCVLYLIFGLNLFLYKFKVLQKINEANYNAIFCSAAKEIARYTYKRFIVFS